MSFLVLRAYLKLIYFDFYLARSNFSALYDKVRNYPVEKTTPAPDAAELICSAVDMACIWYWKEALCLQRSAATSCLLKRHGIFAQMVIGARQMPFRAHTSVKVHRHHGERSFLHAGDIRSTRQVLALIKKDKRERVMSVQFGKWNFEDQPPAPDYIEKVSAFIAPYGPDGDQTYRESRREYPLLRLPDNEGIAHKPSHTLCHPVRCSLGMAAWTIARNSSAICEMA